MGNTEKAAETNEEEVVVRDTEKATEDENGKGEDQVNLEVSQQECNFEHDCDEDEEDYTKFYKYAEDGYEKGY